MFSAPPSLLAQELYGLVVGINDYEAPLTDLRGAVNDAKDVERTLRLAGSRQVFAFHDKAATKARIQGAWTDLVGRAKAGDTIVFAFAGHGSQERAPAHADADEDGRNDNFLLAGFAPNGRGFGERIVDKELKVWLKDADDRGIRVVVVADSCHSGGMTRTVGLNRAGGFGMRFRGVGAIPLPESELYFAPPDMVRKTIEDYRGVTFLTAVERDKLAPEVTIAGEVRGALSWAFSRAIEGRADQNKDGRISQQELSVYIRGAVHQVMESQQTPETLPLAARGEPILPVVPAANRPAPPARPALLKVAVEGGSLGGSLEVAGARFVTDKAEADLVYDMAAGTVDHRLGGRVAENVTAGTLMGVIAKWSAIEGLKAEANGEIANFSVSTGPRRYHLGETLRVELKDAALPYLTLFNLPPNGRVEFFFPRAKVGDRADDDVRRKPFRLDLVVRDPPFGAEHLVAILTDAPLPELHQTLAGMATPVAARELPGVLARALAGRRFSIGVAQIYTSGDPRPKDMAP